MNRQKFAVILVIIIIAVAVMYYLDQLEGRDNISNIFLNKEVLLKTPDCSVTAILNKPKGMEFDAIIVAGGGTTSDSGGYKSALKISDIIGKHLNEFGYLTLVILYKQETAFGTEDVDDLLCAVNWVKRESSRSGLVINKVYLLGHSRGGYLVSLANMLIEVDGVIANSFIPNMTRFYEMTVNGELAEFGSPKLQQVGDIYVNWMVDTYNGTPEESSVWEEKSIIYNVDKLKARSLFVIGTDEDPLAHELMGALEEALEKCDDCADWMFSKPGGMGHYPFYNQEFWEDVLGFIGAV